MNTNDTNDIGHEGQNTEDQKPLLGYFRAALDSRYVSAIRQSFQYLPVTDASEYVGARLICRDLAIHLKTRLLAFNAAPDITRDGLARFFISITRDTDAFVNRLPDETGKDADRPRGIATDFLRREGLSLSGQELIEFTHFIANINGETSNYLKRIKELMYDRRYLIVEQLNEIRQIILEGDPPDIVRAEYDAIVRYIIKDFDRRIDHDIPKAAKNTAIYMDIYPVVHINDPETASEQGDLALKLGADGVYLIDHNGRTDTIFETLRRIRAKARHWDVRHWDTFIGVNLLGHRIDEVYGILGRIAKEKGEAWLPNAVWADNVEHNASDPAEFLERKNRSGLFGNIKLLGGISFKYTSTFSEDPETAGAEVARLRDSVDVITTSGAGTGKPPTAEKLKAVREAACGKPVAVASGISAENIHDYAGLVDQILVSTSVETHPYSGVFDAQKLEELIKIAHGMNWG